MNTYTAVKSLLKNNKLLITQKTGFVKLFLIVNCLFFLQPVSAQLVRSATAPIFLDLTLTITQYRADLGAINPNVFGSFSTGRREINWDGVPDALSAPNNLPANFFNVNSPRGVIFSTPGTGFQVSANAGIAPVEFSNINPTYSTIFQTFSPQRLFTALGSNITDVSFFIPGSNTPALTRGFGAVFTDVDLPNTTSIQYFDRNNNSLGIFYVPNIPNALTSASFLGVSFPTPIISRVRITSGNAALGPNDVFPAIDGVVMDDFIYGEPIAACPVINLTIPNAFALPSGVLPNTVYIGYAPASSITLTSTVSGGTGPYTYTWSTGSHADAITVSPVVTTTYSLSVSDANGCRGSGSKTVNVIDIRGGKNLDKVVICHKPAKKEKTLTIGEEGVADHLSHGDRLGSCSSSSDRLIVGGYSPADEISIKGRSIKQGVQLSSLVINVYPNPSSKGFTLNVQGAKSQAIQIRVLDMQGHLIERKDNILPDQTIKFGNTYKPGTYILETIQGSIKKQQKIIKIRY